MPAFPVPIYTTATQIGGSADKRVLSETDPNSESSATQHNVGLGNNWFDVHPEQNAGGGGSGAPASGQIEARGWGYLVDGLVDDPFDTATVSAGTWTFALHYSRPGGLLTSNITVDDVTIVISRAVNNPSAGASLQEIGRVSDTTNFTITTTEQSRNISVTGVQATFNPGERIWIEVYIHYPLHVTSDTARWHTQSASALRITNAPNFTVVYGRNLNDSAPAADAVARKATYARYPNDAAGGVSDGLIRKATYPRALNDAAPAVADSLGRLVAFNRFLNDSAPVSDALARQISTFRRLADSIPVSDSLRRELSMHRSLADAAPAVSDGLIRQYIANRILEDSHSIGDAITRMVEFHRVLNDAETVSDALARQVTYRRYLEEQLSEGGEAELVTPFVATFD